MATLGNSFPDLIDLYRRQDPNSQIANIIELLMQINPIMEDAIAIECNDGTSHLTTVRTGLPAVTWRKLYKGINPGKSLTAQVRDTTGFLEAWSEIDEKLLKLAPDKAAFRLSEAQAFIEAMGEEMATGLFYHDTATDPDKFMGLAPRFNSLSAQNATQIVDAAGAGSDNTSIWFIVWSPNTTHLLYPKGTKAGLDREDLGTETKELGDGSMYRVVRERFMWDIGLSVRDYRYIARVANIDVTALKNDAASGADLEELMIDAFYKLRQPRAFGSRVVIYCNTTIKKFLHQQSRAFSNTNVTVDTSEGEEKVRFLGYEIKEVDALVNTEATVA